MKNLYSRILRLIDGRRALRKYLFKCKECGHEFRLQAWRVVCPNCEKSNSLVKVDETPRGPKLRPRIFVTILLMTYAAYSVLNFSSMPDLPLLDFYPFLIILIIGAAFFALSGSLPSNILSIVLGGWIAYSHILRLPTNNYHIFFVALGLGIAVAGMMDELMIRKGVKLISS